MISHLLDDWTSVHFKEDKRIWVSEKLKLDQGRTPRSTISKLWGQIFLKSYPTQEREKQILKITCILA